MQDKLAIYRLARAVATMAAAVTIGIGMAGCGGSGYEQLDPAGQNGTPSTPASPEVSGQPDSGGDPPAGDSGSGSGGANGGGTGGSGGNTDNGDNGSSTDGAGSGSGSGSGEDESPYIRDYYPEAYVAGTGADRYIEAILSGHAYDPAGPHKQENTARVEIRWGDGTTTDAGLGGHGAFDAYHEYDLARAGQTMTVTIVAHGHDGRTATQKVHLPLPEAE